MGADMEVKRERASRINTDAAKRRPIFQMLCKRLQRTGSERELSVKMRSLEAHTDLAMCTTGGEAGKEMTK
jgi:hypothetical protein